MILFFIILANCSSIFCFKVKQKYITPFGIHFSCGTCHLEYICERCARFCHKYNYFIVYSNSGHKIYRTKCMIPRICYCGIESGCKLIVSKSKTELLADK